MQDSVFAIFIAFGCIWILIGVTALIMLLKSDAQEIQFGKWGLIVAIPILIPIVLGIIYQLVRPLILQHL